MYTLEIKGIAIATTDADEAEAGAIFMSDEFKEDLAQFTIEGKPVWDGKAELVVRPATEEETDLFVDTLGDDFDEGDDAEDGDDADEAVDETDEADEDADDDFDDAEDDGPSIMFLVDIDQLSDDE